jgi:oxalate---CoA ligase
MTTLLSALDTQSPSPALINTDPSLSISYSALTKQIHALQTTLAHLGVGPSSAVTLSLPNTPDFAIAFLAIAAQRAIAAPLNPAYKQEEVEFYIDDIRAVLALVPRGAVGREEAAVMAARKFGVGVAEVWFQDGEVRLEVLERGKFLRAKQEVQRAEPDDVAVPSQSVFD